MLAASLLVGLAAGLWPRAIYPSSAPAAEAALPTLQTLAVSQVVFVVLIWPLMLMRWISAGALRPGGVVLVTLVYLLVSLPFYVAAAWLADAGPGDVVRTVVYVACLVPLGWAAGACMARGRAAGSWVLLVLLVFVAGCPAAYYIAREFLSGAGDATWLWRLGPVTGVWDVAAGRGASVVPGAIWPLGIYVAAAAVIALVAVLAGRKQR